MIEEDDNIADAASNYALSNNKRKHLLVFLLPLLIVIGLSATIFFVIQKQKSTQNENFSIVQHNKENAEDITVFYDLPEITSIIKGKEDSHELKFKLNLELPSIEDLQVIKILTPKLNDLLLSYTVELSLDEISGSYGLYWFKEELLYRLNLAAYPTKIKNINFASFDIQEKK